MVGSMIVDMGGWKKLLQELALHPPMKISHTFLIILNHSKVSFENLDMAAIRKIILEWDEAKYHLSTTLMKRIKMINSVA